MSALTGTNVPLIQPDIPAINTDIAVADSDNQNISTQAASLGWQGPLAESQ